MVASGVTSRGPSPVPPVVRTISALTSSEKYIRDSFIVLYSSGTILYSQISNLSAGRMFLIVCPLMSSLFCREQLSLTVRIAALIIIVVPLYIVSVFDLARPCYFCKDDFPRHNAITDLLKN